MARGKHYGMACYACGEVTYVLSTREGIFRRRECLNGHRFSTEEVTVETLAVLRRPRVPQRRKTDQQGEKHGTAQRD